MLTEFAKYAISTKTLKETEQKAIRAQIAPGSYEVDAFVHVKGTFTVNEDEETTPTYALTGKDTLALLLKMMGCTREHASNLLIKVAKAKLEGVEADPELMEAVEKGSLAISKMAEALPKVKRKGKVLGHLSMSEVEFVPVAEKGVRTGKKVA